MGTWKNEGKKGSSADLLGEKLVQEVKSLGLPSERRRRAWFWTKWTEPERNLYKKELG